MKDEILEEIRTHAKALSLQCASQFQTRDRLDAHRDNEKLHCREQL